MHLPLPEFDPDPDPDPVALPERGVACWFGDVVQPHVDTDGLYRETRAKVARRRDQGCLTVEMEAAALFAVAAFRGATYAQMLYAGDDLSAEEWDHRGWDRHTSVRERLLELACGAALRR